MGNFKMPKLTEVKSSQSVHFEQVSSNDIAIIGISIDLPMADNIEKYWDILCNKVSCIRELPERRKRDCDKYLNDGSVRLES